MADVHTKPMGTKERILDEALTLFSERGYTNVFVGDIAERVGIKAPSLYKHYKNKQAIYDAIIDEMNRRYTVQASTMNVEGTTPNLDAITYADISVEQLVEMGKSMFLYFLHDDYTCRFRKMLTIEQFHDKGLAGVYNSKYADEPLAYQGMIFKLLTEKGVLSTDSVEIMTIHFYAPIYMMMTICDREPEREPEVLRMLEAHLRQFSQIYRGDKNEDSNT